MTVTTFVGSKELGATLLGKSLLPSAVLSRILQLDAKEIFKQQFSLLPWEMINPVHQGIYVLDLENKAVTSWFGRYQSGLDLGMSMPVYTVRKLNSMKDRCDEQDDDERN